MLTLPWPPLVLLLLIEKLHNPKMTDCKTITHFYTQIKLQSVVNSIAKVKKEKMTVNYQTHSDFWLLTWTWHWCVFLGESNEFNVKIKQVSVSFHFKAHFYFLDVFIRFCHLYIGENLYGIKTTYFFHSSTLMLLSPLGFYFKNLYYHTFLQSVSATQLKHLELCY